MTSRRKLGLIGAGLLLLLVVALFATRGPADPLPNPPGTFSFAVFGDAPYFPWETLQYELVLTELEANDLSWVIQVGDIFWRPCSDELYGRTLAWLDGLRHPVIYTPGDNEWTDCWESGSGSYAPLERLARLRELFFADPARSLGGAPIALESQGSSAQFSQFVENVRWQQDGFVFATVHLVGSWNGLAQFPARTEADDAATETRTVAATVWMRETFEQAIDTNAQAVVLSFHANPFFEEPVEDRNRQTFEPFIEALEEQVEQFGGPVLVTHGDHHDFLVDHPLVRRTTGRTLENLTRLQVPGSPKVGWVRVTVTPGATEPFAFEARVIPHWKYW